MENNPQLKHAFTGTIIRIEEPQTFGAKGFRKASCVIEVENDKYPQRIEIQAIGKSADLFKDSRPGDVVTLQCNITGTDKVTRCFNQFCAWKLESKGAGNQHQPQNKAGATASVPDVDYDSDSIPF